MAPPQRLTAPSAALIARQRELEGLTRPMPAEELADGLGDDAMPAVRLRPATEEAFSGARAAPVTVDNEESKPFRMLSHDALQETGDKVTDFLVRLREAGEASPTAQRILAKAGPPKGVDVATAGGASMPAVRGPLGAPRLENDQEGVASNGAAARATPQAAPSGDTEFAAAQDEARGLRSAAALSRAGAMANEAISGARYDTAAYADMEAGANTPVAELLARREADKRKRLEDPTSPESRRFQQGVSRALGGVYSPEEIAEMSAADEPHVARYGEMRQRLDERREAASTADMMRRSSMEQEQAQRADERAYQERQAATGRGFQASEAAKQRAFQREVAGVNNAADLQRAQARSGIGPGGTARGTVIPGLEVEPGAAPTPEDAKKVKASRVAAEKMRGYVGELRALHQKYGTEYGGAAGTRMEQLGKAIQLEAKTIAELGALSGPDQALMESISGADPSGLGANLKALVGVDNTGTALDGLEQWVATQEDATKRVYGYRNAAGDSGQQPTGDMVPMLDPQGRQRMVPRARVQDALASGGRLLNG
jgi:hypothetical protein